MATSRACSARCRCQTDLDTSHAICEPVGADVRVERGKRRRKWLERDDARMGLAPGGPDAEDPDVRATVENRPAPFRKRVAAVDENLPEDPDFRRTRQRERSAAGQWDTEWVLAAAHLKIATDQPGDGRRRFAGDEHFWGAADMSEEFKGLHVTSTVADMSKGHAAR